MRLRFFADWLWRVIRISGVVWGRFVLRLVYGIWGWMEGSHTRQTTTQQSRANRILATSMQEMLFSRLRTQDLTHRCVTSAPGRPSYINANCCLFNWADFFFSDGFLAADVHMMSKVRRPLSFFGFVFHPKL